MMGTFPDKSTPNNIANTLFKISLYNSAGSQKQFSWFPKETNGKFNWNYSCGMWQNVHCSKISNLDSHTNLSVIFFPLSISNQQTLFL